MSLRIAIPEPTASDHAYNARSLPQYIAALQSAGATAVVIPLHERPDRVARLMANVHGILLPGSGYDIEPQTYGEQRIPECGEADAARSTVDAALLKVAFNLHKPILAICYGLQSLNVWRGGALIQDLTADGKAEVNHAPGRTVADAHPIQITPGSLLSKLAGRESASVNSSHHQAARTPGDHLTVTAICPTDGVIEAMELVSSDHFVLAVQWHPERTYTSSELSRAIFGAFIHAAETCRSRVVEALVAKA